MKVRSDILRVYKSLHTWTGIVAGLVLFIGFLGGALTMFKQPLARWATVPQASVSQLGAFEINDQLIPQVLGRHPHARSEFTLHLRRQENVPAPMSWEEGRDGHEVDLSGARWFANMDSAGALQVEKLYPSTLGELVDLLHRTAGIPGFVADEYVGVYVMGVAAVLYFLALVSGLILLLPTLVKDFFALRPGRNRNRKRFWLDAHNVIGISSLPFHIVISLTVIVFAFHDQFYDALKSVVYRQQAMFTPPPAAVQPYQLTQLMPMSQLLAKVKLEAPDFEPTEMLFMRVATPRPMVRVALESETALVHGPASAYLVLNPYTGAVINDSMLPGRESTWSAPVNMFFALHFGSFGGQLVRWLYFALGLGGAFLFYSGNLLWLESRQKRQRAGDAPVVQSRSTRWMASATVGSCLGCVIGICVALLAGKWLPATGVQPNELYMWAYYCAFLVSLMCAFWLGAARAAVHLLIACAVSALAIPLTTLSAYVLPRLDGAMWGPWSHSSLSTLAVDGIAALASVAFIWAALLTRRRVRLSVPGAIWSVSEQGSVGVN